MTWIALETDRGLCYLDPDVIVGLGSPMWNKARTVESRAVVLRNGGYQLVLNSEANIQQIRGLSEDVPPDAHEHHAPVPAAKLKAAKSVDQPAKRGRKKAQP